MSVSSRAAAAATPWQNDENERRPNPSGSILLRTWSAFWNENSFSIFLKSNISLDIGFWSAKCDIFQFVICFVLYLQDRKHYCWPNITWHLTDWPTATFYIKGYNTTPGHTQYQFQVNHGIDDIIITIILNSVSLCYIILRPSSTWIRVVKPDYVSRSLLSVRIILLRVEWATVHVQSCQQVRWNKWSMVNFNFSHDNEKITKLLFFFFKASSCSSWSKGFYIW